MKQLTNHIIKHIYNNLGLNRDLKMPVSIKNYSFLLEETIDFNDESGDLSAQVWGAQIEIENAKFKIIVTDLSEYFTEHAMLVKLDGCPTYACYLSEDLLTLQFGDISFSLKEGQWLKSSIGIQATFLAGMENLRDVTGQWSNLKNTENLVNELKSYIKYLEINE